MSFHLTTWSFWRENPQHIIYELAAATAAHEFLKRIVDFLHNRQPSPPAFTLPQTPEKHKGGDLFETRYEADQEAEDPAGTSRARTRELAYREAEAGRGAGHPPQAHKHHPGCPDLGIVRGLARHDQRRKKQAVSVANRHRLRKAGGDGKKSGRALGGERSHLARGRPYFGAGQGLPHCSAYSH